VTPIEWALAGVGFAVTALVVIGMILLTPRGEVQLVRSAPHNGQGVELSRAELHQRRRAGR
jgi:hypothetical protein